MSTIFFLISWPSPPCNMTFSLSYTIDMVLLVPCNLEALATPSIVDSRLINNNFSFVAVSSTSISVWVLESFFIYKISQSNPFSLMILLNMLLFLILFLSMYFKTMLFSMLFHFFFGCMVYLFTFLSKLS